MWPPAPHVAPPVSTGFGCLFIEFTDIGGQYIGGSLVVIVVLMIVVVIIINRQINLKN